jgi:hypothetical protein
MLALNHDLPTYASCIGGITVMNTTLGLFVLIGISLTFLARMVLIPGPSETCIPKSLDCRHESLHLASEESNLKDELSKFVLGFLELVFYETGCKGVSNAISRQKDSPKNPCVMLT